MNKALLLCCSFLLWAAQLVAAPANVNFVSEHGVPFELLFDGRPLTRSVSREVYIDRVQPGFHWAEFRIPAGRGFVKYRTRVFLDAGYESNYILIARRGFAPVLRKVSAVPIRYNRGPRRDDDRHGRYDDRDGRYEDRDDRRDDDRRPDYDTHLNQDDDREGRYEDRSGYNRRNSQMSSADVDDLIRAVDAKSFDSGKLSIAKDALSQADIRSEDLKRLLRRFDFESQRLELAKYASSHVADPQNFYQVYELFNFDSNIKELQQYSAQTRQNDDYRPGGYDDRSRSVMTPAEVDGLLRAASSKSFDKDKLAILQDGLARTSIRTEDLKRMLRAFSFEDQRLELAKYAYSHVIDPQNFPQVYALFNFNSNVDALRDYINQQPRR